MEHLKYSDYAMPIYMESKIVPGTQVLEGYTYTCPACSRARKGLQHGEVFICKCGLKVQLFGNQLNLLDGGVVSNPVLSRPEFEAKVTRLHDSCAEMFSGVTEREMEQLICERGDIVHDLLLAYDEALLGKYLGCGDIYTVGSSGFVRIPLAYPEGTKLRFRVEVVELGKSKPLPPLCPFCGKPLKITQYSCSPWYVSCSNYPECGWSPTRHFKSREAALKWASRKADK